MPSTTKPGSFENITVEDLSRYQASHQEDDYLLVDVRQPEEYASGHIPGACLLPLGTLEAKAEELSRLPQRRLIFYCRSGGRSARASAWAAGELRLPHVANLLGGFSSYTGAALPDFPRLKVFESQTTLAGMLRQALALEKGAHLFYQQLAAQYHDEPVFDALSGLAAAEITHAQAIHRQLTAESPHDTTDFGEEFAQASQDLVESGESWAEVTTRARQLSKEGAQAALELALGIELAAYDLYKNLAERSDPDRRAFLLDLAQQERHHADRVLHAMGRLEAR